MSRKSLYWTRKLELELVNFIRDREYVWKSVGNTNHHIQQKYKAFAEFAARQGRGFTACAVRDRWVNIRSTFHHNLRKVERSKKATTASADVYVPCWPLWKPLQFLREALKKDGSHYENLVDATIPEYDLQVPKIKQETQSEIDEVIFNIRQRSEHINGPRFKPVQSKPKTVKCVRVLDNLIQAMKPLIQIPRPNETSTDQTYWFLGKHVTERLKCMSEEDAICASRDIMAFMKQLQST